MKLMTPKQRKALQQVVLEAAAILTRNRHISAESLALPYSCLALEEACIALDINAGRWERKEFSHAYWHVLMGGEFASVGERLGWDDMDDDAYELRLLMLALLHTLIGSGDFETLTGYRPYLS